MSLIKNLVKEPEKKRKGSDANDSDEDEKPTIRPIIKSATDLQRLKIEKLMKNPDKPVQIPDFHSRDLKRNREPEPPSFVRNVMGSSAGAGSGEFHVYRHLRRKEYARQKGIQIKSLTEQLDQEYQQKLEENKRIADEKTAKKRAKRLKKKQRSKVAKKSNSNAPETQQDDNPTDSSDDEEETNDIETSEVEKKHIEDHEVNQKEKDKKEEEKNNIEVSEADKKNVEDHEVDSKDKAENENVENRNLSPGCVPEITEDKEIPNDLNKND